MDEARARQRLGEERSRLEGLIARLELDAPQDDDAGDELAAYDQHQGDAGTELYQREHAEGLLEDYRTQLAAIARAEARLDDGTYGQSVESGELIPDARLEAVPWAERTIEEEARFEARGGDAPGYLPSDDDTTPLDRVESDPPQLADIPMSEEHRPIVDPGEDADEVQIDMGGESYHGEGGAPEVGEPDPDDDAVERLYRPDR